MGICSFGAATAVYAECCISQFRGPGRDASGLWVCRSFAVYSQPKLLDILSPGVRLLPLRRADSSNKLDHPILTRGDPGSLEKEAYSRRGSASLLAGSHCGSLCTLYGHECSPFRT